MKAIVNGAMPPVGEILNMAVTPGVPPVGAPAMIPVRIGKSDDADTAMGFATTFRFGNPFFLHEVARLAEPDPWRDRFLEAFQRHRPTGGIADELFQLIPPVRRDSGVGVERKPVDTGTVRTSVSWRLALSAKA